MLKGTSNRASVDPLVARKTRFVTLARMERNGAAAAVEGFTRQMKRLPAFLRQSLTYGCGMENGLPHQACPPPEDRHLVL